MNFFKKLARKRLSEKEQIRLMFRDQFDGCIKSKAFRKALCGDPVLDGMLAQTAIGVKYKTYKESKQFRALCGITILKSGYNPEIILEEEMQRALKLYCGIAPSREDPYDNDDFLEEPIETIEKVPTPAPNKDDNGVSDQLFEKLNDDFCIKREDVERTVDEQNIAPDLSKNNELENKLFAIAKQGVDLIQSSFRSLSDDGYAEALIYCSSYLIDLGTEHKNEIDLDIFEDRYFLLLADEVMYKSRVQDTIEYINSRVGFFNEQERKLKESPNYTPMFIFNAFYLNPGCESPGAMRSFPESPFTLIQLHAVLKNVKEYMSRKASELGYGIPNLDSDDDFFSF